MLCAYAALPQPAIAQIAAPPETVAEPIDIVPAKTVDIVETDLNAHTHPPIRLTPDKSELIRLDKDAATIVVGNPAHLSVLAESPKTLVLVPRSPGATYFTVLNAKGEVVMQRHAIVASPKKEYVRIRRTCSGSDAGCAETSVFYCPDMCHQIAVARPDEASDQEPAAAAAEGAAQQSNGSGQAPPVTDSE